jgi:uncharacterized protein (DUF885 family)
LWELIVKRSHYTLVTLFIALAFARSAVADQLDDLAQEFWEWRAVEQPFSGDDIPRLDRPAGWTPDWSAAAVARRRQEVAGFEQRWGQLKGKMDGAPVPRQVDYRLVGSALARVRWELDVTRNWQRDPAFYLSQSLGGIFELLLRPPPFTDARSAEIVRRLQATPRVCENAKVNLTEAVAPFARLTIAELEDVGPRLSASMRDLKPFLTASAAQQLNDATKQAISALESYREWLERRLPAMSGKTAVGREAYLFFLREVALLPFTPEQILAMARQEWERAVAFQAYEEHRNKGLPPLELAASQAAQTAEEERDELAIRRFLEEKDILTVPSWVQHYQTPALPSYIAPIQMGVTDDLTGPGRLKENGTSYIRPPSPQLGYFARATASDPRTILVHEGVPGHYFQLVLSWSHENPIRRHYYDSGANEGIGFYAEEMMLQAGLFDNKPRTREIIYNFGRLRALRVEVDVKLALGQFSVDQAAKYLQENVPMDSTTPLLEATSFAAGPGQAISYQIGKVQIMKFLADTQRLRGDAFSLRAFHDFVWKNGNVPIALQRWEYLGLKDEIEALESAGGVATP